MNLRDNYGFNPKAYGTQGRGRLLDALDTMMGREQRVEPGSEFDNQPEYAPASYIGSQGGLIGRLLDVLQPDFDRPPD